MLKVWSIIKPRQAGFSMVELLLAAAVFGLLSTGLIGAVVYGRSSTASAGDHNRATYLAEEGINAVQNIGAAAFANLPTAATTVGDTTIEAGSDNNPNGTSSTKVTTGATGGAVTSVSIYLKTIDATNQHVQAAIYADSAGTPGARLGISAVQTAVANSWNTFPITGVTATASTSYWLALSEDGATQFADNGTGSTSYYHTSAGGYPAPNPFAANIGPTTDKPSFYMSIGGASSYGLVQSGGVWTLSGSSDTTGIYTRQVSVTSAGTNRDLIVSTVTWPQAGGTTGSVTLTGRIANWKANLKLWSNAVVAGSADVTGTNNAVKTSAVGNYAYTVLSATTNNFVITNISTPTAPVNTATVTLAGTPTNIFVKGNYAYITNSSDTGEFQVVDITNPAAPVLKATLDLVGTGDGLGVYVSGNFAYVSRASDITTSANELTIINVTTPTAPVVSGGYNNNIAMNEVYVSGTFAYVATNSTTQEMLVINVTNPAAPTLAATYNPATTLVATTITGYGNTVLLGMSTTLDAINVTTPTAPVRLGVFTAAGTINDVDVDITNQFAFLGTASTTGEFQVVNIGTPAAMTLAKTVDVAGTTSTVGGVSYDTSLDIVVGASAADTQEVLTFTRN